MPIEIKEMHINIKVNYTNETSPVSNAAQQREDEKAEQKEILDEYYESIMEVINNKNER